MMAARRQREILTYSLLINACDTSVNHPTYFKRNTIRTINYTHIEMSGGNLQGGHLTNNCKN